MSDGNIYGAKANILTPLQQRTRRIFHIANATMPTHPNCVDVTTSTPDYSGLLSVNAASACKCKLCFAGSSHLALFYVDVHTTGKDSVLQCAEWKKIQTLE